MGRYLKSDLIYLLIDILIASIITHNDLPSQWLSEDPILGHDVIKHIMSERKFLQIMRHLQVCDMNKQVSREHLEYDPLFKVREFQENLKHHFNHLFVPGH